MKTIFLSIIAGVVFTSCVKQNTPSIPLNNTVDTTVASLAHKGTFMNGPYGSVSGNVKVYKEDSSFVLALVNISASNGPDLHVYISKEVFPVNFIDLGSLQSTSGNQLYSINGHPDFTLYKHVLIHCKRFNHLFGSAELQ